MPYNFTLRWIFAKILVIFQWNSWLWMQTQWLPDISKSSSKCPVTQRIPPVIIPHQHLIIKVSAVMKPIASDKITNGHPILWLASYVCAWSDGLYPVATNADYYTVLVCWTVELSVGYGIWPMISWCHRLFDWLVSICIGTNYRYKVFWVRSNELWNDVNGYYHLERPLTMNPLHSLPLGLCKETVKKAWPKRGVYTVI